MFQTSFHNRKLVFPEPKSCAVPSLFEICSRVQICLGLPPNVLLLLISPLQTFVIHHALRLEGFVITVSLSLL